jgi:hypothetical protein
MKAYIDSQLCLHIDSEDGDEHETASLILWGRCAKSEPVTCHLQGESLFLFLGESSVKVPEKGD